MIKSVLFLVVISAAVSLAVPVEKLEAVSVSESATKDISIQVAEQMLIADLRARMHKRDLPGQLLQQFGTNFVSSLEHNAEVSLATNLGQLLAGHVPTPETITSDLVKDLKIALIVGTIKALEQQV